MIILTFGCQKEPPQPEKPAVSPVQIQKPKPASFIICIDNSRSIRGQEQIVIRETTMLLADLAEIGDRVSVVTFGKGARLVASSLIKSDQDRIAFKKQVQKGVNFKENFSDIRAGVRTLAKDPQSPLQHDDFTPYIIIFSDGKLEPADKKTKAAFKELIDLRQNELADINFYTVVLGNTYCNDVILKKVEGKDLNGKLLMRNFLATSDDHFFHAQTLDQLLNIAVDILNKTKGISAIGEKAQANQFRIDDSVETMTLIVRKRSMDGKSQVKSSEILLNQPQAATPPENQSVYRSSAYRYFDLFVVRNPVEGIWSVTLADGNQPEVFSKIVTPLELKIDAKSRYYSNESALFRTWVFDQKTSQIVKDQNFQIKAHLAEAGQLDTSNVYADFHVDAETGQHYLEVPAEIIKLTQLADKPDRLSVEVIARRFKGASTELDPWFIRRSPVFTLHIVEPFFEWSLQKNRYLKLPFKNESLEFGVKLDTIHPQNPGFEVPPGLNFSLDRYDEESNAFASIDQKTIQGEAEQDGIIYREINPLNSIATGSYRYRYQLKGVIKRGGPFLITSPRYHFAVQSYSYDSWQFWLAASLLGLFFLCLINSKIAKMQGTLTTDGVSQIINAKRYSSEPTYQNRFELRAKRFCFFRSGIVLTVTQGSVVVDTSRQVTQGQKIRLAQRLPHTIYHDEAGKRVERQLMVNI